MKNIILIIITLTSTAFAGTCGNGYSFHRSFAVNHFRVAADQTNFPVSYYGTLSFMRTVANGGEIQNTTAMANGSTGPADFIICDAAASGNAVPFEVESYVATSGAIAFHYTPATLSASTDTTVYLFTGNVAVVASQENVAGTWANGFLEVWHLGDGTTMNANGSLGHISVSTAFPSATSGVVDGAGLFDGATNYIDTGYNPLGMTAFTVEVWASQTSGGNLKEMVRGEAGGSNGIGLRNDSAGRFQCYFFNGGAQTKCGNNRSPSSAVEHYACTHAAGVNAVKIYRNSTLQPCDDSSGSVNDPGNSAHNIYIGAAWSTPPVEFWPGKIDNVRLSSAERSASWIQTEYELQHNMRTSFIVGTLNVRPACGVGFTFSRLITIDHTLVGASDLTNFPYQFKGTFLWLRTVANGGKIINTTSGYTAPTIPADIQFCTVSGTELAWETDVYSPTTGVSVFWVNLPTISHTTDTTFKVYYNNASVSFPLESATTTWILANYATVYHLGDGTTLSLYDSGPAGNDLTAIHGAAVSGEIAGGASGTGTDGIAKVITPAMLPTGTAARGLELWTTGPQASSAATGCAAAWGSFSCGIFTCSPSGEVWGIQPAPNVANNMGMTVTPFAWTVTSTYTNLYETNLPNDSTWHKFIASSNTGNSNILNSLFYQDGVLQAMTYVGLNPSPGDAITTSHQELRLGACLQAGDQGATQVFYNRPIDEVRISTDVKSADWNLYEHANDSTSTDTIGPEEAVGLLRRRSQVY